MIHSINLSFDRGNLIAVYIEGEIEPMVQLSLAINADHTLHLFCEADQVENAIAMLRDKLQP